MDETLALARLRRLEIETPVLGLRELRHALPRLPLARRRARRSGSGSTTPRSSTGSPAAARRSRCTSPGTRVDDCDDARGSTPRRRASGSARSTRTCSATTPTGSGASATPTRASARRRSTTAASASRSRSEVGSTVDQPLARRRHELPGPGRPARPRTRGCRRARGDLRSAAGRACGCSSSTSSSSRPSTAPTCPTGARRRCSAAGSARRRRCSSTPATIRRGRTSSRSSRCCSAEGLLGGFHFNNRKYADDDLIVGSIDPFELFRIMREIARAADAERRRVHDRPVAQRRGQDRRDDPVGA